MIRRRYPGPVAFLVAGRDQVVFADLGLALFEARTGPKRLWLEARSGHNDLGYDPRDPRWREVTSVDAARPPAPVGRACSAWSSP
jgi:uncharacterized protein